jgi:hypothetical protein
LVTFLTQTPLPRQCVKLLGRALGELVGSRREVLLIVHVLLLIPKGLVAFVVVKWRIERVLEVFAHVVVAVAERHVGVADDPLEPTDSPTHATGARWGREVPIDVQVSP